MSALNAVTAAYHVSHWAGWVCAYTRGEGALAVALAPPEVPPRVGVPVICLRGPNREQIRYSLGAGPAPDLVLRGPGGGVREGLLSTGRKNSPIPSLPTLSVVLETQPASYYFYRIPSCLVLRIS